MRSLWDIAGEVPMSFVWIQTWNSIMIKILLYPETEYLPLKHFRRDSSLYIKKWLYIVCWCHSVRLSITIVFYNHCQYGITIGYLTFPIFSFLSSGRNQMLNKPVYNLRCCSWIRVLVKVLAPMPLASLQKDINILGRGEEHGQSQQHLQDAVGLDKMGWYGRKPHGGLAFPQPDCDT